MEEDYIDYFKDLFIKLGDLELPLNYSRDLDIEIIPRKPEQIKKDISRCKSYFDIKKYEQELQESYKYYNKLKQDEKIEIEKERKLRNKVENNLREEKEFLTEEEYKIAFEQEYNILKYGLI